MADHICSVKGCDRRWVARTLCDRHWQRWRVHGDPTINRDERTPSQRFWEHVDRNGPTPEHMPHLGRCWMWTGHTARGYGRFSIQRGYVLRTFRAHRFSYELHCGPIPEGMLVCHHCDNPSCVRPEHLFMGTTADNMRDKSLKGRTPRAGAILKPEQVIAIRKAYAAGGVSQYGLAAQYGVTRSAIAAIARRRTWRELP